MLGKRLIFTVQVGVRWVSPRGGGAMGQSKRWICSGSEQEVGVRWVSPRGGCAVGQSKRWVCGGSVREVGVRWTGADLFETMQ